MAEDTGQQSREAMVEARKMEFEVHKTQATLGTGSIVAVIALSELLVPDEPRFVWLLGISCFLLLYSMTWALNSMFRLATEVMIARHPQRQAVASGEEKRKRGLQLQRWSSILSFSSGIGLFAAYVWLNIFV